ncbi:MAG: methyltransferase domain-containing protein [Nitrospinota bacterium]
MTEPAASLLEGRSIHHQKYTSTVQYRLHQEERSHPDGRRSDAVPYIALALEELANYFPDGARVLCVGPRDGYEMEGLRDLGFEDIFGIDISLPSVSWMSGVGLRSAAVDMHEMAFAPETFDVVFSRHSLEHAHTPERVLREMSALLRPGGVICVIVPKETPETLGTHHGHAFTGLAELVEMIEATPGMRCVAGADRPPNNALAPEVWAVAVKGESKPLPDLRDRTFTRVWDPLAVAEGTRDGSQQSVFAIYRRELLRRMRLVRPAVLEILGEPGPSPTVVLQMEEEAWRVSLGELPVWEGEVEGQFDAVLAAGILDVSPDPPAMMRFLENLLSPKGVLAVVEPGLYPTGLGNEASQGMRPTEAGLAACLPGLSRVGVESLGPEGSPFAVAAVWRKDDSSEPIPGMDDAFRIPFPPIWYPSVEFFGGPRPYREAFEADFLRRMGGIVRGDVLFLSPRDGRTWLGGCDLRTARFLDPEDAAALNGDLGGPYDTVIGLGVLGRSRDPRAAMGRVKALLRPGGAFLFGETCLAPLPAEGSRPLLWRLTRPALARLLEGFHHVRMEAAGPANGPLAYYGWSLA